MSKELDASMRRSRCLYEEIFGKGNYAAADELLAEDIINHGPGSPPVLGTEGIKRQAALLRTAVPDLRAILNLPSGSVEGSGKSISFDEIRIDRHASGRIVESWWIPDRFTLWQQLGLLPAG